MKEWRVTHSGWSQGGDNLYGEDVWGKYAAHHAHDFASKKPDSEIFVREVTEWQEEPFDQSKVDELAAYEQGLRDEYRAEVEALPKPEVGQEIYVGSSLYIDHGEDDFCGGLAHIEAVEEGKSFGVTVPMVRIKEKPGTQYNWKHLYEEQDKLRERYKGEVAHPCPDDREEFQSIEHRIGL